MLLREEVSCPSGEFLAVKLIGGELASAAALAPRVRHFSNRVRVDRGFPQSGELFFNRSAPCLQWCFVGECTVERRHGQSLYQLQRTRRDAMYGVCWVGVATLHPSCGTDQCYLIV